MNKKTKILCILDGFGLSSRVENNCIANAKMPKLKKAFEKYKMIALDADGIAVGQEQGLVGNSEVGHMNIGGLQKIPQLSYQITNRARESYKIDKEHAPDQNFDPTELIQKFYNNTKHNETTINNTKTIHIISLFSSGRVHSDLRHIKASIQSSINAGSQKIILHIITDGRDTDKKSFYSDYTKFKNENKDLFKNVYIGSVSGRFYAMDRDNNRERTLRAVEAMFCPIMEPYGVNIFQTKFYSPLYEYFVKNFNLLGIEYLSYMDYYYGDKKLFEGNDLIPNEEELETLINYNYKNGNFDEYIEPISYTQRSYFSDQLTKRNINPGDTIWFINYRTDRFRQLVTEFLKLNKELDFRLNIIANNNYDIDGFDPISEYTEEYDYFNPSYYCIFEAKTVKNPLSKVLSEKGFNHLHISETEKFNHVTYFFNGGQNIQWDNEKWHVETSNKVKSHAQKPEMKAKEVTDYIINQGIGKYDFIVVNFANPDMVGHTGDFEAGIKSMEYLDTELGRIIDKIEDLEGGEMIITADHGNIEKVGLYSDKYGHNLTDTEHNSNPVPCLYITDDFDQKIEKIHQNIKQLEEEGIIKLDKFTKEKIKDIKNHFAYLDIKKKEENIILKQEINRQYPLYINGILILSMLDI